MGSAARVILSIPFSFRAIEQGFSSWKPNCQIAIDDSESDVVASPMHDESRSLIDGDES